HAINHLWPMDTLGRCAVSPDCIVLLEQAGRVDYARIHDNFSFTEIVRAKLLDSERSLAGVMRIEQETGAQAYIMVVVDADGVEYTKNLDLGMGPMAARSDFMAQHYAGLAKHIIFVNVPSWASTVWRIMGPLMPEQTRSKVRLFSSKWREEIRSLLDPSICPVFWNDECHDEFAARIERPLGEAAEWRRRKLRSPCSR
ncbi:hypothetical protein PENTCL1PPCAC_14087, partial [Pristionchus entomophagus]